MTKLNSPNLYVPTIGIECHVQLKTQTKLFSAVPNDAREAAPNTLVSQICFGLPGALPVLNAGAIKLAIRAAFALGTSPQPFSKFDRKLYFYPDLPKGYQITQYDEPIIKGGFIDIIVDGQSKRIGITRAHLEEDAGKSIHPPGTDYSLVDLNRAGTPLLEIVSEPDMHSPVEAKAFARELWLMMRYAGVSDADLYHGNMRFDVNVSLSLDSQKPGTRTETKNLNSFRSVEKAVAYEIKRQIELLNKGATIVQETRGWDDAKQKTFSQRSKEDADEYRYFPEPDIPPLELEAQVVETVRRSLPVMPGQWRVSLAKLGLDNSQQETLLEAELDDQSISYLQLIERCANQTALAKALANWFINVEIPLRRAGQVKSRLSNDERFDLYQQLFGLTEAGKLSSTSAKHLLTNILQQGAEPKNLEKYAEEQGHTQVSNEKEIEQIVRQVLAENPKAAGDVKNGEQRATGFLIGQVMKKSLGKANPELAQKLIRKWLS